jgi:tetratricopeptide (TPR) repeat protein
MESDAAFKALCQDMAEIFLQIEVIRKKGQPASTGNVVEMEISSNNKEKLPWLVAVAASIALLIVAGIYIYLSRPSYHSTTELYTAFYEAPEEDSYSMARGKESDNQMEIAFAYYHAGEYEKAASTFSQIYEKYQIDTALFYLAISQLELQQWEAMTQSFEHYREKYGTYGEASIWYEGMANLKMGRREEATKLLSALKSSSEYGKDARKILAVLPKLAR